MNTIIFENTVSVADIILFITFLAILWYSLETRWLRQWQTRQVQATLLMLDMQRVIHHAEHPSIRMPYKESFPIIMRKIYELGEFDIKDLYSSTYHGSITEKNN